MMTRNLLVSALVLPLMFAGNFAVSSKCKNIAKIENASGASSASSAASIVWERKSKAAYHDLADLWSCLPKLQG